MVLVPGGLADGLAYRGRRRPELVTAVILFVFFYMSYECRGGSSGELKGAILGSRYVLPLVPLVHSRWSDSQSEIREAIYDKTEEGAVLITNSIATRKFLCPVYGRRLQIDRDVVGAPEAALLLSRHGYFYVVLLDRSDSSFWIDDTGRNSEFVATLGLTSEPLLDRVITKTD